MTCMGLEGSAELAITEWGGRVSGNADAAVIGAWWK